VGVTVAATAGASAVAGAMVVAVAAGRAAVGATVALAVGRGGAVAVDKGAAVGIAPPKGAHAANATVVPNSTARTVRPGYRRICILAPHTAYSSS